MKQGFGLAIEKKNAKWVRGETCRGEDIGKRDWD